ncbi:MAG: PQQ-dependent sugar dehydrogenase [Gemmatimonadota bacterium]
MSNRILLGLLLLPIIACNQDEKQPAEPSAKPSLSATIPPPASVNVTVTVPSGLRSAPFDVPRQLTVPPNFSVAVYARVSGARFMAMAPNGNLLVSQPNTGKVLILRQNGTNPALVSTFASGLNSPHDMVFHVIGTKTYLYIAEANQVNRYVYTKGDLTAKKRQVIVTNLPQGGHNLKNLALDPSHNLYVSIGSSCNVCPGDSQSNPQRAAIYRYNADGTGGQLFASGLRNAEGLDFVPGTSTLWVVVNNRDNIPYPFNDASGNYGKVIQSFVDNHPPDEFTRVASGANYGWPFCNPNPDLAGGMVDMPFDLDYDLNATGTVNCGNMTRINMGIQAHSAPLGLKFFQNTNAPSTYRTGAAVALHGSWNRSQMTGSKVIFFAWDNATSLPVTPIDLVTGWLVGGSAWGRPVDVAVGPAGKIFISDDQSGTIYRLSSSVP